MGADGESGSRLSALQPGSVYGAAKQEQDESAERAFDQTDEGSAENAQTGGQGSSTTS